MASDAVDESFTSKRRKISTLQKEEDIDALGIFYNKTSTSISDFITLLRERKSRAAFPDLAKWFVELTEKHLNFNLDINKIPEIDDEAGPAIEERELIEYLDDESRELESLRISELRRWNFHEDELKLVLFNEWISSTKKFIELTQVMIQQLIVGKSVRPRNSGPSKDNQVNEKPSAEEGNIFSDVFAKFTEIFFLLPVSGRKTSSLMNYSLDELCFYQYLPRGAPYPVLMKFCEAEIEPSLKSDDTARETWIEQQLSKKVLGQIGFQLVSQCFSSAFLPNVLGIICMKTHVIFVYLTINSNHVKVIRSSENASGHRACIHYTEAFDIMKKKDRAKILELMFWLGCVQKYNLHRYYLKQ